MVFVLLVDESVGGKRGESSNTPSMEMTGTASEGGELGTPKEEGPLHTHFSSTPHPRKASWRIESSSSAAHTTCPQLRGMCGQSYSVTVCPTFVVTGRKGVPESLLEL